MYLTPWVQRLLIANVAMYFIPRPSPLYSLLRFDPSQIIQHPWSLVTYMFLHADTSHLFWNMFSLFIFGPRVEDRMGGRDFLKMYFLAGVVGAESDDATYYAKRADDGTVMSMPAYVYSRLDVLREDLIKVEAPASDADE